MKNKKSSFDDLKPIKRQNDQPEEVQQDPQDSQQQQQHQQYEHEQGHYEEDEENQGYQDEEGYQHDPQDRDHELDGEESHDSPTFHRDEEVNLSEIKNAHDTILTKIHHIKDDGEAVRDSQDNDPATKQALDVRQNDAGFIQFTDDNDQQEDTPQVDQERLQFSLTHNLQNMPDANYVPKEELMLSKLVEQDEELRSHILQVILYQTDIEAIVHAIVTYFREDSSANFVHCSTLYQVLHYLDIEIAPKTLLKVCRLTDSQNGDQVDLQTLFECVQDNFMLDGDKDFNPERQRLLDAVQSGTWNLAQFDVLICLPADPVLQPLLQEQQALITHYFVNSQVQAQATDEITEVSLKIPHIGENWVDLNIFLMDWDKEDDATEEEPKKVAAPESILETLMVGTFVMGGSERIAEIQEDFKAQFGVADEQVLLNHQYQRDIQPIQEERESIAEDSRDQAHQGRHMETDSGVGPRTTSQDHSLPASVEKKSRNDKVVTQLSNNTSAFENRKVFSFHTGTFDFGKKGFWSEGWKCCGKPWNDEGCKKTKIDPQAAVKLLICYNQGEVNPRTGRPDSICGCVFPRGETQHCLLHPGYFDQDSQTWTCCNELKDSRGCQRDIHTSAFPPELNSLFNYIRKNQTKDITLFDKFDKDIAESQFWEFRAKILKTETFQNNQVNNSNDNTEQLCKNIGCMQVFRKSDKKGQCVCHKGSQNMGNTKFNGHWTCCSKPYESPACTQTEHSLLPLESAQAQSIINVPCWPDYKALQYMQRNSTTGNKTWNENVKILLSNNEDASKLFEVLKNYPRFVENEVRLEELGYLLKTVNLDDCCASTDPRALRFFFLREEFNNNPVKVQKRLMTDDDFDAFQDSVEGLENARLDYEKFIEWFSRYVPYPLKEQAQDCLSPRSVTRLVKVQTERMQMFARSQTGGSQTVFAQMDPEDQGQVNMRGFIRFHEKRVNIPSNSQITSAPGWLALVFAIKRANNVNISDDLVPKQAADQKLFDSLRISFQEFQNYQGPCATEGPCGRFELCELFNNLINTAKENSQSHSEYLKFIAEKTFCLRNLPDNLKNLFSKKQQGYLTFLLKTATLDFPCTLEWASFADTFRYFQWLPTDMDDSIRTIEDRIENGKFPSIPMHFNTVIDLGIFVTKLVNHSLKPINTQGVNYSNEWSRIDMIEFFNLFVPAIKCPNFEIDDSARSLQKQQDIQDAFKHQLEVDVTQEVINLITVLFCQKVSTRAEVKVDLNLIIAAVDVHALEHGSDSNQTFDPKNSKLEQMMQEVKHEQERVLQDLLGFNAKQNTFSTNQTHTKNLLQDTIQQMHSIQAVVDHLDQMRLEKQRREEQLMNDANSEATTFEHLTVKVQMMSKQVRDELAKKTWVEQLLESRLVEVEKKFDKQIQTAKAELTQQIKDATKGLTNKISILEKKIAEESTEHKNGMTRLSDKFQKMQNEVNNQIKQVKDTVMLPKNPSKNKHASKCLTDEGTIVTSNTGHVNGPMTLVSPNEIPNVLPNDQFFTMLKEHQSSIVNLETKIKALGSKGKATRNLSDELDLLKTEIDKKQNADTEIFLRNELNKQEKEIRRLRDELTKQNESVVKSKQRGSEGEKNKDIADIKDQICSLTNLVKYSMSNVEERLFKVEDFTQDLKDLKRNRTLESRMEFKYNMNRQQNTQGRLSDQRTNSNERSNVFDRLAKKKSYLYYDEMRDPLPTDSSALQSRPDTASTALRPQTGKSHDREVNRSAVVQPGVRRPDSGRVKSSSQGNMRNSGNPLASNNASQSSWFNDPEQKRRAIFNNQGVEPKLNKATSQRGHTRRKFKNHELENSNSNLYITQDDSQVLQLHQDVDMLNQDGTDKFKINDDFNENKEEIQDANKENDQQQTFLTQDM